MPDPNLTRNVFFGVLIAAVVLVSGYTLYVIHRVDHMVGVVVHAVEHPVSTAVDTARDAAGKWKAHRDRKKDKPAVD